MAPIDRRHFLRTSALSVAAQSAVTAAGAADKTNEKIVLAVLGLNGRGRDLLHGFSALDDVEVASICDPDENVVCPTSRTVGRLKA